MYSCYVSFISMLFLTFISNAPTPIPEAAPVPDSPMKCSLPMLLAKREAPTCSRDSERFCEAFLLFLLPPLDQFEGNYILTGSQNMCLPARKKPLTVSLFFLNID